jgi:hypothetical protein
MKRASLYLVSGAAQLFGVFSSAQAQVTAGQAPSTPATAAIKPGTPVSELVVVGGAAPKVSATFPADKTEVPGGILVVKVVFDQPMTANAWSFGPLDGSLFPHCLAQPRLLADHRTSVLLCSVAAHQSYVMRINPTPGFVADGGRAAQPFTLTFTTSDVAVRSLHDALDQAGLKDADEPIMQWNDDGKGVSASPVKAPG